MSSTGRWLRVGVLVVLCTLVLVLPRILTSGYMINAMIDSIRWVIFALSFDLAAGHVGAVSLGHPAFFGIGAYITALLGPVLGFGFVGNMLLSAVLMALLALVAGIAFFRIRGVTFAIGTLGAVIIAQLFVNNAYDLTGGPLCVKGVPRPEFALPLTDTVFKITQPTEYYYLLLPLLVVTILTYRSITTERIGRAFTAVREDEVRASAVGVYPLRYKLLALAVGAGLIGALGSFQAQYVTVVCPSELSLSLTITLLIIVFVGGAGRMRGVMISAIIFSTLPRIFEAGGAHAIPSSYQQIAYGIILILVMLFLPEGLDGLITRVSRRLRGQTNIKTEPR